MRVPFLIKRLIRSWKLFLALLLGIILASTFFSSINLGPEIIARDILDDQINDIPVDIVVNIEASISPNDLTKIMDALSTPNIDGVMCIEVLSYFDGSGDITTDNKDAYFGVVGITGESIINEGLDVRNGSSSLGLNETYVWADSPSAGDLKIGDTISFNFTWREWISGTPKAKIFTLNLTVVGFVDLEDQALRIAAGRYWPMSSTQPIKYQIGTNILIVDWEKTMANLTGVKDIDTDTKILVFLDRKSLINFWEISGSIDRIWTIETQIDNRIYPIIDWGHLNPWSNNYLEDTLRNYEGMSATMRIQFLIVSLPIFFVAWYMGSTISDVSYNLRRREIGLLLTKGFSRRQLLIMFLSEAILIGLSGGLVGIGLSVIFTPMLLKTGDILKVISLIHTDTIMIILTFGVSLTLLSVFRSARRASKLDIIDALKEYRYVEEVKPSKMRWPLVALLLGTYKIAMWIIGINLYTIFYHGPPPGLNILLSILLGVWMFFDVFILNYIGPLLFFWGFTKIFLGSSLMFQKLVTKVTGLMGDLGILATKNIRRNPARTASIAFVIALIIGFSFQVVGSYYSERDYIIRQVKFNVGADISAQLSTIASASSVMEKIGELSEVSSVTTEYRFYYHSMDYSLDLVAINPIKWPEIAYYEENFFTGKDAASTFSEMEKDNETIILEKSMADITKRDIDDKIKIIFYGEGMQEITLNLRIVGFYNLRRFSQPRYYSAGYYGRYYCAYISHGLYETIKEIVDPRGRILVKLEPNVAGKVVAEKIRNLHLGDISTVSSVSEILETVLKRQQNRWDPFNGNGFPISFGLTTSGSMDIQWLGVFFAVLAASLGTALVTLVSLKERSHEVGILGSRGLSFNQMVRILMVENLSIVVFSVFLGGIIGIIISYGNISAANSMPYDSSPILRQLVFPLNSVLILLGCCAFVFASTIIPVVVMSKRYLSEMERIVREI